MTFPVRRRFLLGLAASGICVAQDLCSLPTQARAFAPPPNADAYTVLDTIGKAVPFQTRTIRLFPSSSALVKQRGGAAAQLCGAGSTERWIFYDPAYIDAVKPIGGKSDLPRYFVLAHEAAHHINGDTLLGNDWNKDQELAADYSAAVWLTRLGVSREQLLQTFEALEFPVESANGYPTRAERRENVIQGYEYACSQVAIPPPNATGAAPRTALSPAPFAKVDWKGDMAIVEETINDSRTGKDINWTVQFDWDQGRRVEIVAKTADTTTTFSFTGNEREVYMIEIQGRLPEFWNKNSDGVHFLDGILQPNSATVPDVTKQNIRPALQAIFAAADAVKKETPSWSLERRYPGLRGLF